MRSPEYVNFFMALHDAPFSEVGMTADTLLGRVHRAKKQRRLARSKPERY
jgi:hypothetical protein